MNNNNWIAQVRELSKENKRDKAVRIVRHVLKKDNLNPEALWIIANISTSHPEKYAALKTYVELSQYGPLKYSEEAQDMLGNYMLQYDLINELERAAPAWSKDVDIASRIDDFIDAELEPPEHYYDHGFRSPFEEAEISRYEGLRMLQNVLGLIRDLVMTLSVVWRLIRWIFSPITWLFSQILKLFTRK